MALMDSLELPPERLRALLDILTHHEAYAEIAAFKCKSSISTFGEPMQEDVATALRSSPLIRLLLHKFILVLPGLREVDADFWTDKIPSFATALANCNLSESYDKGSIGIRRTLSTAIAALVERVSYGVLGGFSAPNRPPTGSYNVSIPGDIQAAWNDFLQQTIYGNLIDSLFAKAAETDDLSEHDEIVQAAHEYVLIMFVVAPFHHA